MFRNRSLCLTLILASVMLSGCAFKDFFITDTGSGKQSSVLREDYLDTSALETSGVSAGDKYHFVTLEKGSYSEDALKQTVNRAFYGRTVTVDIQGENMRFGGYSVGTGDKVEKGDEIAYVYTDADEISLTEARLALQRLENEYDKALRDSDEALNDLIDQEKITYDSVEKAVMKVEIKRLTDEKSYIVKSYESRIKKAKEDIDKKAKVGKRYSIKAEQSGYVYLSGRLKSGTDVTYGDYVANLVDASEIYIYISNQSDQFVYGQQLSVNTSVGPMAATVISAGNHALYSNLDDNSVTFKLIDDGSDNFNSLTTKFMDSMMLVADIRSMHDVVLVPREAVMAEQDGTYVNVYNEETGGIVKTEFIAGGRNTEYYWVLSGLNEGTVIAYN